MGPQSTVLFHQGPEALCLGTLPLRTWPDRGLRERPWTVRVGPWFSPHHRQLQETP